MALKNAGMMEERKTTNGTFQISVRAMNNYGFQSEWYESITVTMPNKTQLHVTLRYHEHDSTVH